MKKLISVLLVAAALLPACSDKADITDSPQSAAAETVSAESELYAAPYLPDADYEGYVFRMVTVPGYPSHVTAENGDIVNDAYYRRNQIIEERYNIEFEESQVPDYNTLTVTFRNSAAAASDDFDLCRLIMRDAFSLALEGYVAPVSQLPYLDITQDWYIHYVNEELSIGGELLFAYSDDCVDTLEGMFCVFFNKALSEQLNLTSPYELTDSGGWTLEAFYSAAAAAIDDLNGDGKYTLEEDRWGIISEHDMILPSMWVGAGKKTVAKDADDIPYFIAHGDETLYSLLTDVYDFWITDGMCYDSFLKIAYNEKNRIYARGYFIAGSAMFIVNGFGTASRLRDMESDFGIVPLPKYDEVQQSYYTRLCDGWLNLPLYCAADLSRTGVIMESLAVESKNYVIPAIYDRALLNKYIRDEETVRMLDIIQRNRIIDLGDTIWMAAVRNIFMDCFRQKKPEFASAVEKNVKSVEKTIEKTLEAMK
ncbi:MAG: hypothetical protein PHZ09_05710 [Eubacteriales bacterium]|nr:hypothetical protein [Eubacteriales bacterium]